MNRYDIKVPQKSRDGEKTYWKSVGSAFPTKNGGWRLVIPPGIAIVGHDEVSAVLMPPYDKDKQASGGSPAKQSDFYPQAESDDIPF